MDSISSSLGPYAQQLALHALRRISGAQFKVVLQYQDPPEVIRVGETDSSDPPKSTVTLNVRSPNLWMRICSCFDLVRIISLWCHWPVR